MADVQYVTLYISGATPVTAVVGSALYNAYLAAGADLYPTYTPPGSGIPTNPADPFPQYITATELNTVLANYSGTGGGGGTPVPDATDPDLYTIAGNALTADPTDPDLYVFA